MLPPSVELGLARGLDVAVAFAALIFFGPLLILTAVMVKLEDGGPILYSHRRVGKNGRPFGCLKFRSMAVDADARLSALIATDQAAATEWAVNHKLRDDPRVTRIGRFLRQSSLDEFPQLFNVLKGDMSVVGPRPIVEAEIARYGASFADYCLIRPGITGLWQISGRSDLSYSERVSLDADYARRKSLAVDIVILAKTIPAVLFRRGSY